MRRGEEEERGARRPRLQSRSGSAGASPSLLPHLCPSVFICGSTLLVPLREVFPGSDPGGAKSEGSGRKVKDRTSSRPGRRKSLTPNGLRLNGA